MSNKILELAKAADLIQYGRVGRHGAGFVENQDQLLKFVDLLFQEIANSYWTEDCNYSDLAMLDYSRKCRELRELFGL